MIETSHSGRKPSAVMVTCCPKSKFVSAVFAGLLEAAGVAGAGADAPPAPPQAEARRAKQTTVVAMRILITSSPAAANQGSGRSARAGAASLASSPDGLQRA